MGVNYSRSDERVEGADLPFASYRYPPKSGNYFSSHFIMGDQTFAGTQPESFLFGTNSDLNYLPPRPVPFPYPETPKTEPTRLLRSLVNLRKNSLRLVKHTENDTDCYYVDFVFDADVKCVINVYYLATEDLSTGRAVYTTKDPALSSRSFEFSKGANQSFETCGKFHLIKPNSFKETDLIFSEHVNEIPVIIQISTVDEDYAGHCNITMANIEKTSEETFTIKLLKQKQMVDGVCYLLHEIYGLESKEESENGEEKTDVSLETDEQKTEDTDDHHKDDSIDDKDDDDDDDHDDYDDENVVCVVCMSEARDTLMLPCKHLCVCSQCAGYLRRGSNNCPICRIPFHALLQLCAYQKAIGTTDPKSEEKFPGYIKVDLFDALNSYNIGKECASSRDIVRRVSARANAKARPGSAKSTHKAVTDEPILTRRSSSRFSRTSVGSHKRDKTEVEPVENHSRSSLRRSKKGSTKSHVIDVDDKENIDLKKSESSQDMVEGLELGVEVGQDNLGMDAMEEENLANIAETGFIEDKPSSDSHNPVYPLPGTPLDSERSDTPSTSGTESVATPQPGNEQGKNVEIV